MILADPHLALYIREWPRPSDFGIVAETAGERLGATWWRFFSASQRGYGYVGPAIPEITIGVVAPSRGTGIGRSMLVKLIEEARNRSVPALSLSVEHDNYALNLYRSVGFTPVERSANAGTMVLRLET
jgi:ribosomal protein S18 acetylase RimI-like enzyme